MDLYGVMTGTCGKRHWPCSVVWNHGCGQIGHRADGVRESVWFAQLHKLVCSHAFTIFYLASVNLFEKTTWNQVIIGMLVWSENCQGSPSLVHEPKPTILFLAMHYQVIHSQKHALVVKQQEPKKRSNWMSSHVMDLRSLGPGMVVQRAFQNPHTFQVGSWGSSWHTGTTTSLGCSVFCLGCPGSGFDQWKDACLM